MSLANGFMSKIISFGIVKIKMFDRVVCDLGDVAYVLISISWLVTTGCRVNTTQGGDYGITHGRMILTKGEVLVYIVCGEQLRPQGIGNMAQDIYIYI